MSCYFLDIYVSNVEPVFVCMSLCHCMSYVCNLLLPVWICNYMNHVIVWVMLLHGYVIGWIISLLALCHYGIYHYVDNYMSNVECVISIVGYEMLLMYISALKLCNYVYILDIHSYLYHELLLQMSWNLCNWLNIALFELCV